MTIQNVVRSGSFVMLLSAVAAVAIAKDELTEVPLDQLEGKELKDLEKEIKKKAKRRAVEVVALL